MINPEILKELGLTDSESKVYLALLELGPSLAGTISRKTGIHRRNIYDITERLVKKGLIGYILKNNRRLFEAANPERLKDILDEKQKALEENLGDLKFLYQKTKEKQETNFYKGVEGLKTVFQDQLEINGAEKKEILILGASQSAFEVLPFYFKWYDEDRVKKKIKVRIIATEKLNKKIPLAEIRHLPQKYANPLAINIYGNKVAIILWKKSPIAIVIKEKEVADSYRQYFELMWRMARK
ncbi:MAG: helix-turn-helix domain-containing protein [Nanoarchaeota archaeon]|nr:helix-turn-helix domain-containing protein [Nanoarchaeota archaeon]